MTTAIDDIEALAAELEAGAAEAREHAEQADARARDLRAAATVLREATAPASTPFATSIATRPEGARGAEQ